jgi:hypothetical protein
MEEFSHVPEKFMFFDIKKLNSALKNCGRKIQLRLFLNKTLNDNDILAINKSSNCFQLGCVPIVNLFSIHLNGLRWKNFDGKISLFKDINGEQTFKNFVYFIENVSLSTEQEKEKFILNPNELFSPYEDEYRWTPLEPIIFDNDFHEYSEIQIENSMGETPNNIFPTANIKLIALNKLNQSTLDSLKLGMLADKNLNSLFSKLSFIPQSGKPSRKNPHLRKNPMLFLKKLPLSNFYYNANYNRMNLIDYLKTYETEDNLLIKEFIECLENVHASLIAGEGQLPDEDKTFFITNGMKFCFEMFCPPKGKLSKHPSLFLLLQIIGAHFQELCSNLSFVKITYKIYEDFETKELQDELNFPQNIFIGKRND